MSKYDHKSTEKKWREKWEKDRQFYTHRGVGEKLYLLFAFPYPSGAGLHVGHVESMTALDIMARYNRMKGRDVFFPIGWDAFGLPAENYAIKTGTPPEVTTKQAIKTFKRQIREVGISYSWDHELATSHPGYYRWTQWLFLRLYEKGLAYKKSAKVNWCPDCQTVLANEQVVNGLCERSDTPVEQREMEQWFFRITDYVDRLLADLDTVDWPKATLDQQRNWIGKSEGIEIAFEVVGSNETIDVFTTWPTNWGASFLVLAPEHPGVTKIVTDEKRADVEKYLEIVKTRSESVRTKDAEKTGVFTGAYAKNHVTGKDIPIYVSDFVLMNVGTGAIQGCPGHDGRDFEFAKKFGIDIPRVVVGPDGDESPIDDVSQVIEKGMPGKMINSDFINGLSYEDGIAKTIEYFVEKGWGKRVTKYRIRDWLISRQRYWGPPIPIVYDPDGKAHPVKEEHLPWTLPTDVEFKPTGESPLKGSREFNDRVERLYGKGWKPEYDTMDTFVDSSWYFLRYPDPRNEKELFDLEKGKKWLPPDFYMIGPEHIVLHLLYSRFLTKFLKAEGIVDFGEPFPKMRHQGIVMGPDGKRMSKSRGNVINPDEVVEEYGADTLRIYEMFMGPIDADKPWDVHAVSGARRFVERIYRLIDGGAGELDENGRVVLHKTLKKVGEDIVALKFNTAIAAMMEMLNQVERKGIGETEKNIIVRMIAPFAPYLSEELWGRIGGEGSVHEAEWPQYDDKYIDESVVKVVVQVNGKVRDSIEMEKMDSGDEEKVVAAAKGSEKVMKWIEGGVRKVIFVPGRLVNFVV